MAISIETCRNEYVGDGSTTVFPYVFKVWTAQDLNVIKTDTLGNETLLVYPSDYTATGVQQTNGGNVVLSVALTNLYKITIRRVRKLQQTTSIRNETEFFQATHEDTFDKLLMLDQQQEEEIKRRVRAKVSENSNFSLELPSLYGVTERVIGTNLAGDGLELGPTFSEIAEAEASALAAIASATAALASETSAVTAATDALTNATDAANAAAAAALSAAEAATSGFDQTHSPHSVTDGQTATSLSGEVFDGTVYTSVLIFFEIIRGTTVSAVGTLSLNYLNSTWRFQEGNYTGEYHGVTWSMTQATTFGQLKAALDSGAGNGTIKFKKTYFGV